MLPFPSPPEPKPDHAFDRACALVALALAGDARRAIVAEAARAPDLGKALWRLRDGMRAHAWRAGDRPINLDRAVKRFDSATRQEGFHVLHDWDGKAELVNPDIIPVDVLHYVADKRAGEPPDAGALAVLLDYYFFHILQLLSLRAWDEGDPNQNLDRLTALVGELQGPNGSGQRFADDAETLVLVATSHYERHEHGYTILLDRVRTLDRAHRTRIAVTHAQSMGSHLRFGFEAAYGRDTITMRKDNVADYPWLCWAIATVMEEYARMHAAGEQGLARETVVEAMLNGLASDARAFVGDSPLYVPSHEQERVGFRTRFLERRADLLAEFEPHRPSPDRYSPLGFFFNFSHNVLKGLVIDVLLRGIRWDLSFNDLLTGLPRDETRSELKIDLAGTLMAYARSAPDRIRGRLMPVVVYDAWQGREAFSVTMRKLRE